VRSRQDEIRAIELINDHYRAADAPFAALATAIALLLIAVTRLRKVYQRRRRPIPVFTGLDLTIGAGEFAVLKGPSGIGKTTLLNLIGGLDRPPEGSLIVAGQDLGALAPAKLAEYRRRSIGFGFRQFHLLAHLSAKENVALPLLLLATPGGMAHARARARQQLARLGLQTRAGHRPDELSAGQQQRVAIARALVKAPALILAGEPTGMLDVQSSAAVVEAHRQGVTVVVATHSQHVDAVATTVLDLRTLPGVFLEDHIDTWSALVGVRLPRDAGLSGWSARGARARGDALAGARWCSSMGRRARTAGAGVARARVCASQFAERRRAVVGTLYDAGASLPATGKQVSADGTLADREHRSGPPFARPAGVSFATNLADYDVPRHTSGNATGSRSYGSSGN